MVRSEWLCAADVTYPNMGAFFRSVGLPCPLLQAEAERERQRIEQTWDDDPMTPVQIRFLALRRLLPDLRLSREEAYERICERSEQEVKRFGHVTWRKLVRLEPRLIALEEETKMLADIEDDEWDLWYMRGGLKARLSYLVGWGAEQPGILATSRAYDVVYRRLQYYLR